MRRRVRALPYRRPAEGLGGNAGRPLSQHVPIKLLGRYFRTLLVHAGKHRAPDAKARKLLAKLILASSDPGGIVLDPFAGSGSTAVTAKKLGRRFVAIERSEQYCAWAEKRLELAETTPRHSGLRRRRFLGAQCRPPAALNKPASPGARPTPGAGFVCRKFVVS